MRCLVVESPNQFLNPRYHLDAFNAYQEATGATMDNATGLLTITAAQFKNLKDLNFKIGDDIFPLTPNAQIWPRALNTVIGGTADSIYLIVASVSHCFC